MNYPNQTPPQPIFNPQTGQWELPAAPSPAPYGQQGAPAPRSRVDELRAQIIGAQVSGRGNYFAPVVAQFRVAPKLLKYQRSAFQGTTKEAIIAEFTVMASSLPDSPPGCTRSIVYSFKHLGWLERFKALALAMGGVDPAMTISAEANGRAADVYVWLMDDAERQRVGAPAEFWAGVTLDLETMPTTARSGTVVPYYKWTPVRA